MPNQRFDAEASVLCCAPHSGAAAAEELPPARALPPMTFPGLKEPG